MEAEFLMKNLSYLNLNNHLKLEMEAEFLTKNLSYLNLNISRTKKWYKQDVKSTRIKKSYRTYRLFTQITDKNSQFAFKLWSLWF